MSSWDGSWPSTAATSSTLNARSSSTGHPPDDRQKSVSDDATVKYPDIPGRFRSVGNQPEPKLTESSTSMKCATSSGDPSR